MQNVVLIIHLLLALGIIGVVLLQRSEGGGLGIGGGGNMGPQAGRPPLTGLAKLTWGLAVAFIITSLTLTVFAAQQAVDSSVLDRIGIEREAPVPVPSDTPDVQLPPAGGDAPLLPPRED